MGLALAILPQNILHETPPFDRPFGVKSQALNTKNTNRDQQDILIQP